MRKIITGFIFILLMISNLANSQYAAIFAVVTGDTVTLWQTGAWRNCAAHYNMEVNRVNENIEWYQVESGGAASCNCYFDLSVQFGPLEPGFYSVKVFYVESFTEDTIFEGTTYFYIMNSQREVTSGIISQYQSDCYHNIGLGEKGMPEDFFNLYPNPLKEGELLHLEVLMSVENSVLEIFTLTGNRIYSKQYDENRQIRDTFIKNELFPVPGIYVVRLKSPNNVYIRKIAVL